MINVTFSSVSAYDYNYTDAESVSIYFTLRLVSPYTFMINAEGYRTLTGEHVGTFYEQPVYFHTSTRRINDDMEVLMQTADECIRKACSCFDVAYNLTDSYGTRWAIANSVGRELLLKAIVKEELSFYPLTSTDIATIAHTR